MLTVDSVMPLRAGGWCGREGLPGGWEPYDRTVFGGGPGCWVGLRVHWVVRPGVADADSGRWRLHGRGSCRRSWKFPSVDRW